MERRETDPLLKPADVAAEFGVDPTTIHKWAKRGCLNGIGERVRLQTYRVGGTTRVRLSWVEAFMRELNDGRTIDEPADCEAAHV